MPAKQIEGMQKELVEMRRLYSDIEDATRMKNLVSYAARLSKLRDELGPYLVESKMARDGVLELLNTNGELMQALSSRFVNFHDRLRKVEAERLSEV